jgi:transcriptional regulator with XRE-family HTH domain
MGMTQEELAEQTGIVASSISKIEHGARKVSLEEAVRFAEVFRISLLELAGLSEETIPRHGYKEEVKTLANQCAQKMREAAHLADNLERALSLS